MCIKERIISASGGLPLEIRLITTRTPSLSRGLGEKSTEAGCWGKLKKSQINKYMCQGANSITGTDGALRHSSPIRGKVLEI